MRSLLVLMALMIAGALVPLTAATSDKSSALTGHSFPIFYRIQGADGAPDAIRRSVLVFGPENATSDLFPGRAQIPYMGTLTTERVGKRGSRISAFNAKGATEQAGETVSFEASKDGDGAKGSVTISRAGAPDVTVKFQGTRPKT